VIDPVPKPDPGPGGGFDCADSATPSGVVAVADPIPGRYVVVFRDPQPGVRAARVEAMIQGFRQTHDVSEVTVFETAIAGLACSATAEEAERMAADPRVAFVQQEGRKRVSPIPAQEGATWGLDRIRPPRRAGLVSRNVRRVLRRPGAREHHRDVGAAR
jgi:hypothetical protein